MKNLIFVVMTILFVSCEPHYKKPIDNFTSEEKIAILGITDSDDMGHRFNHEYYSDIEILSILKAPVKVITKGLYGFGQVRVMVRDADGTFATLAQDGLWNYVEVGTVIKE